MPIIVLAIKYLLSINHELEVWETAVPERRKGETMMTNLLLKYDRACHVVVKWASALGKGGNLGTSIVYGTTHTFVSHIYNSECFTQFITFHPHHSPVR